MVRDAGSARRWFPRQHVPTYGVLVDLPWSADCDTRVSGAPSRVCLKSYRGKSECAVPVPGEMQQVRGIRAKHRQLSASRPGAAGEIILGARAVPLTASLVPVGGGSPGALVRALLLDGSWCARLLSLQRLLRVDPPVISWNGEVEYLALPLGGYEAPAEGQALGIRKLCDLRIPAPVVTLPVRYTRPLPLTLDR